MGKYDDLSYQELQAEARERDIPATGTADDLVERLEADDEGGDGADGPTVETADPEDAQVNKGEYVGVDPQYQNAASHHFAPIEPDEADEDDDDDDES